MEFYKCLVVKASVHRKFIENFYICPEILGTPDVLSFWNFLCSISLNVNKFEASNLKDIVWG